MEYGGQVPCNTEGDKNFMTVVDICLDNASAVGKQIFERQFNLSSTSGNNVLPEFISQVIVSDTVLTEEISVMTADRTVTHADRNSPGVEVVGVGGQKPYLLPTGKVQTNDAIFGETIFITFCAAKKYRYWKPLY